MSKQMGHHIPQLLLALSAITLMACDRATVVPSSPSSSISPTASSQVNQTPSVPLSDQWIPLYRPLHLPNSANGASCPVTTIYGQVSPDFGNATGSGPIYPVGIGADGTIHGLSPAGQAKILWVSRAEYQGPVLIRGQQVGGDIPLLFQEGTEGSLKTELRLQDAANIAHGWRNWPSYTIVRTSGCYAYQIDGDNFSEIVVFQAVH